MLLEQVRRWCEAAGTQVSVRPVIDLATDPSTAAHRPTDAIREQVVLHDRTCVLPGCRRHHRVIEPGLHAWTSPTGATRLVDRRRRT